MKNIFTLILFFLSLSALAQNTMSNQIPFPDTTNMQKGYVMVYPKPFLPAGEIRSDLFKVKWQKTVDLHLNTGGVINYQPESDQGGNTAHPKNMIRILASHIAMNADIKPEEVKMLEDLITEIQKPGLYVPGTNTPTPKPDLVTNIDDVLSETRNVYNPTTWAHVANTSWLEKFFNKTGSYFHAAGSTITTTFDGYKIEWWTEKKNNHGIAEVRIDNVLISEVNLYEARADNNSQKVFEWTGTSGTHKIEIKITGRKHASSTDANIIHDYFKVYKKQL